MCHFIAEVTRQKYGSDYPGATLYQMCIVIQTYLNERGKSWKLVDGHQFKDLTVVLDVMKDMAQRNIGTVKRQANVILRKFEDELWEHSILGEDTPNKLRSTVFVLDKD